MKTSGRRTSSARPTNKWSKGVGRFPVARRGIHHPLICCNRCTFPLHFSVARRLRSESRPRWRVHHRRMYHTVRSGERGASDYRSGPHWRITLLTVRAVPVQVCISYGLGLMSWRTVGLREDSRNTDCMIFTNPGNRMRTNVERRWLEFIACSGWGVQMTQNRIYRRDKYRGRKKTMQVCARRKSLFLVTALSESTRVLYCYRPINRAW